MSDHLLREIIAELRSIKSDIGIIQGDLNAIRNGEYEKPSGALPNHTPKSFPRDTPPGRSSRDW